MRGDFITTQNVTSAISMCAKTPADMHYLSTSLGLCDLYNLVEIMNVDAYNQKEALEAGKTKE